MLSGSINCSYFNSHEWNCIECNVEILFFCIVNKFWLCKECTLITSHSHTIRYHFEYKWNDKKASWTTNNFISFYCTYQLPEPMMHTLVFPLSPILICFQKCVFYAREISFIHLLQSKCQWLGRCGRRVL